MVYLGSKYYNKNLVGRVYSANSLYFAELVNGTKISITSESYNSLIANPPFKKVLTGVYYNVDLISTCYTDGTNYYCAFKNGIDISISSTEYNNLIKEDNALVGSLSDIVNVAGVSLIHVLTKTAFDAISSKNAGTMYLVQDDTKVYLYLGATKVTDS